MARRLICSFFLIFTLWLCSAKGNPDEINLLERYPTTLSSEDSQTGHEWTFEEKDIYSLSLFQFESGDKFRLEMGTSILGIGHGKDGAFWAVVIPAESGTLKSEAVAEPEAIAHIWLRFHPKTISELFPPNTVTGSGDIGMLSRIRHIANWKLPASWHAGPLALIPPPNVFTVDVDTAGKARRFFSVDRGASVKYYPSFSNVVPSLEITREEAEASFDQLWTEYDREYAMFAIRPEVDWNALREEYRPKALQCKTAYEFGCVCAEMLAHLRDLHIWVRIGEEGIPVFNRPRPGNANPKAAASILGGLKKAGQRVEWTVTEDKIGYIAVYSLNDPEIPKQVDQVLESMANTRGIVFDVRLNGGGSEPLGMEIAGRFVDKEAIYSYSQYRSGPNHADLTEKIPRSFAPRDLWRYDRPVILLIGQRCLSSNESFVAMMDQCPQVTMMGDKTGGSSGNPKMIELPIGLKVSMPRWIDLLVDGKPLDERGIQPDIPIPTTEQSFAGDDPVLKAALNRLRKEPLPDKPIVTPEKEPAPSETVSESPKQDTSVPSKASRPSPNVVMVDPLFGATDVNPKSEILVTFDRPMNPDRIILHWSTGGFHDVGKIEYLKDIFQFIIPVQMEPVCTHKVSVPPGSFKSEEGGLSAKMEWSFQTSVMEPDEQAPIPQLASIEPAIGSAIVRVANLRLQFDAPMVPHSVNVREVSKTENASVAFCPFTSFDEDSQTFSIPILFPPNWEGAIQLTGLQSRAGKHANPIQLNYKTGDAIWDETQMQQYQKARESQEIKSLLSSMQQARKSLRSFREIVHRTAFNVLLSSGFTYLNIQSATFAVQGSTQFFADISDFMSMPFLFGNTGSRYWYYSLEQGKEYLKGLLPSEINTIETRFADPLSLSNNDVETALKNNNFEYAGKQELPDRSVHTLRVWRVLPGKENEQLCIDEYWIDAQTFLPYRVQRTSSNGYRMTYQFQFDRINEDIPVNDFAPVRWTQTPMTLEEPLDEGFDARFLYIQDGSNGEFRVEWGKSGPKSYSSVGMN